MGKVRDASKERFWRKLIRRQGKSDETVARFCAREGVPVHQFYWWRRTLRERSSPANRGHGRMASGEVASTSKPDALAFVPVRVPFSLSAPIEVVHPGGCVVRVPAGFDRLALRGILASLEPSPSDTGEN